MEHTNVVLTRETIQPLSTSKLQLTNQLEEAKSKLKRIQVRAPCVRLGGRGTDPSP